MNVPARVGIAVLLFSILACGTLEISVDRTPTPDAPGTSTAAALQVQNSELATKVAELNQVSLNPTALPLPAGSEAPSQEPAAPATRITFLNGASVGVVSAPIAPGQTQSYVLDAFQSQPMFVYLASASGDVTVSISTEKGATILPASDKRNAWQGALPQTGDYYLTIYPGKATENYTLTVTVPWRLQFSQGANSATINGSTVAGYNVSYTVFAAKGQTMKVHLDQMSSKASLAVYGFTDGQNYLHSDAGQRGFQFMLPATQDYIIVVVPMPGLVVDYILTVQVQ
jgi:hypothetical protein